MNDKEREELKNPDNWDSDKVERHSGVKNPRTIVSIGFARPDFDRVVSLAEKIGMNISTFIRSATLEKVAQAESNLMVFDSTGTLSATFTRHATPPKVKWEHTTLETEVPSSSLVSAITNSR